MKKSNNFTLWTILSAATLTVMAGTIIAPVLNLIRDGMGIDRTAAGLIITTHGLFVALFSPFSGILIDRIGPKKPFIGGLILYGVAGGSGLFINSFWPMIMSRVFLGIAVALIANSISVMILTVYKGEAVNKVMGWRGCASSFGGIIWPLAGGALGSISWHSPFAVYTAGVFLGLFALITIPKISIEKKEKEENSVAKILWSNKIIFVIYGLIFTGMLFLYNIVIFLPQLLEKIDISHPFHISLFLSTAMAASGLASFCYDKIKGRMSYKGIITLTMALWTLAFIVISQTSIHYIIGISSIFFGLGIGLLFPTAIVWTGEIIPPEFRGRIISYLRTCSFIGQFLSPVLFGPVALNYSIQDIFFISGIVSFIIFLLFCFYKKIKSWIFTIKAFIIKVE